MIQVGRVKLPNPQNIARSSSGLAMDGVLNRNSIHDVLRAQLDGLVEAANPPFSDEPVVPVDWVEAPEIGGYYRVPSGGWRAVKSTGAYGNSFPWDLSLGVVAGNPSIESTVAGLIRANGDSIDASDVFGWHAIPEAFLFHDYEGEAGAYTTRVSETGDVALFVPTASTLSARAEWAVPFVHYYDGAATLADENGETILGRSGVPKTIKNGLVRCELVDDAGDLKLRISCWGGTAYESETDFYVDVAGEDQPPPAQLATAAVVTNRPEFAAMRIKLGRDSASGTYMGDLAVSLRRGSRMVEFHRSTIGRVFLDATEPDDILIGGRRRTADDADGNRWIMASVDNVDLTEGVLGNPTVFALGHEVGGTGATGQDTAQSVIYQWYAAQDETQRVVA